MINRKQIITAAREAEIVIDKWGWTTGFLPVEKLDAFYSVAFEAGRQAEREECYDALQKVTVTDHSLRTYKRCLDAISERSTK